MVHFGAILLAAFVAFSAQGAISPLMIAVCAREDSAQAFHAQLYSLFARLVHATVQQGQEESTLLEAS